MRAMQSSSTGFEVGAEGDELWNIGISIYNQSKNGFKIQPYTLSTMPERTAREKHIRKYGSGFFRRIAWRQHSVSLVG